MRKPQKSKNAMMNNIVTFHADGCRKYLFGINTRDCNDSIAHHTYKDKYGIGIGPDTVIAILKICIVIQYDQFGFRKIILFSVGPVSEPGFCVQYHLFIVYGNTRYWNPHK
jgi:hypothetical protein